MILALLLLSGITLSLLGGQYLVRHAVELAANLNVSLLVTGLTVVAMGTAASEFVNADAAAWNRHTDFAIGNVIGSSIFNLLRIIGVTALISPIDLGAQYIKADIGILLAASAGVVILALTLSRLRRHAGLLLLTAYAAYIPQLG